MRGHLGRGQPNWEPAVVLALRLNQGNQYIRSKKVMKQKKNLFTRVGVAASMVQHHGGYADAHGTPIAPGNR